MKTKEHILDIALTLFNERGTGPVSTNHIAEAAGISPGNLYYHYRNKEEIIRGICERLFARWDAAFALPIGEMPVLDLIQTLVRANFDIMWDYRFLYREILALLRQDPQLHERFIAVRQRGYEGFREIIAALMQSGQFIDAIDDNTITHLADLCWLISEFWLASLEIRGQAVQTVQPEQLQQGVDLMVFVLRPYFKMD